PTTTDSADSSWHRHNQVITLTCRDEPGGSGCSTTTFCVDQTNSCTPSTQGEDVTVSSEGKNKLRYRSTDVAGNMESIQIATVLIDKSPPTLDCDDCLPDETVPDRAFQIDPSVSDRYSGVRSVTFCADRQCQQILCSGTSCSATFTERGTKEIWAQVTDQVGNTKSVQVGSIAVKRPIGKVCTRDSQCISGNCRENVCRPRAKAPIIDIL
ncbi:MAG: hypothetical protein SVU32_05050, partial [Candidatus Nanohaloarchaea archaeon]|nr:hypothetical protein [Candidatus Nanohaloarchaea archaeon]